ncbi:MAG: hypothetical protein IKZ54_00275 [Bacteroidales bacterium]|nr:hypothetical protein [Bacteroidales bacterium]
MLRTIPPVTTGTSGISCVQRHIFTKQSVPGRPTACLLTVITFCHWEARPAGSRTPSGVQDLVEWGEHGRMRTPLGVRGEGAERGKGFVGVFSWFLGGDSARSLRSRRNGAHYAPSRKTRSIERNLPAARDVAALPTDIVGLFPKSVPF